MRSSRRPPVRRLGAAVATSDALGAVAAVQALPGGKLLVNDPSRRQLLLLDSTMKMIGVVADTTPATKSAYGTRGGGLLPFRGDSALFVDPASLSMLVIDPTGKIARIMATPRANDVIFLLGGPQGNPGFDAKGRLVYRAQSFGPPRGGMAAGQPMQPPVIPDSVPLVRYDLLARKLDTAAFVRSPAPKFNVVQTERGVSMTSTINPLPEVDDWAILPDGTIAILRKDYHVDYVDANGQKTSAPKIPFDWQRLNDSAKTAIIDSAKARMARARAAGPGGGFMITRDGPGGNDVVAGGPGGGPGAGAPVRGARASHARLRGIDDGLLCGIGQALPVEGNLRRRRLLAVRVDVVDVIVLAHDRDRSIGEDGPVVDLGERVDDAVIETPRSFCTMLNFGAGERTKAAVSSLRVSRS